MTTKAKNGGTAVAAMRAKTLLNRLGACSAPPWITTRMTVREAYDLLVSKYNNDGNTNIRWFEASIGTHVTDGGKAARKLLAVFPEKLSLDQARNIVTSFGLGQAEPWSKIEKAVRRALARNSQ